YSDRCSSCLCISFFFLSSRRRHTTSKRDWSSDVCSSDLEAAHVVLVPLPLLPSARQRPGCELLLMGAHGQTEVRFEAVDEVPGDGHGLQRVDEHELTAMALDPRESVEREDQGADRSGDACGGEAAR